MAKDKPQPQTGPEIEEYSTTATPKAYAGSVPVFCAHDAIVPLKDLRPNPKNPNQHPPEQIKLLASIIRATGWRAPITVSKRSGLVTKGHGRLMAAQLDDLTDAPVDYQDYASEAEELADLTADNRIAELATTDNKMLAEVFADIDTGEIPFMLSGYTEDDYGNIVTALSEALHQGAEQRPRRRDPGPGRAGHTVRRPLDPRPAPSPLRRLHPAGGSRPAARRQQARDPADRPALLLGRQQGVAEVDRQHRHREKERQGPEDRQRHPQHARLPKPDPRRAHRHPLPLRLHLHRLAYVGISVRPRRGGRLRRQV